MKKKNLHKQSKHANSRHIKIKKSFHTRRFFWIGIGIAAVLLALVTSSSLYFSRQTHVLGTEIAMMTGDNDYGGTSCTAKSFCDYKQWCVISSNCHESCSYINGKCGYRKPTPKPTPKPSWYQAKKCNTKTYPYHVFDSSNGPRNGTIKTSVCTDEVYDAKAKRRIVEISTNIEFDKLAKSINASCNGQPTYDPVSNQHPFDFGTYPPAGPGARLLIYIDDFSNLTTPDDRKTGISCSGSHTVYTVSPDVLFSHRANVGQKFMGRLSFSVNFSSYGSPLDIDLTGPKITVK